MAKAVEKPKEIKLAVPKLKQNESTKSFKKRVADWERVTGKQFPQSFSGNTNEERVLKGESRNFGLNKPKDYADSNWDDEVKEFEASKIKPTNIEDEEDYQISEIFKGNVNLDKIKLPDQEEVKTKEKVLSSKEKLKSIVQRQADGEELSDDEWEGYLRDLAGEYGGVRMNTGEDTTDDEIPRLEDIGVEETPSFQSDAEMKNFYDRKALNDQHNKETAILRNEQYLKTIGNNGMNDTYTSNYKEAIKADTGWKAFYDDSPDANDPVRRSDVFTRAEADWGMYKKGDVLGVMGRNERRAYDNAMHEAKLNQQHQKNADEATGGSGVYGEKDKKGQGTLTEWTTDQEANEGGKVITGGESAKADVSSVTGNITPKTSDILKKDEK